MLTFPKAKSSSTAGAAGNSDHSKATAPVTNGAAALVPPKIASTIAVASSFGHRTRQVPVKMYGLACTYSVFQLHQLHHFSKLEAATMYLLSLAQFH